jgi:hypothetical protein
VAAAVTAVVAAVGIGIGAPAAAARAHGQVYVIHGIAGEALEVFVDNRSVCETIMTKTVVGPLTLVAGVHTVSLRKGHKVFAQASFLVKSGTSTDLVAHRFPDATRAPTLTAFPNDLSPLPPGRARLLVAHTAAVQPADVLVDGSALVRNLANGESSTSVVPGGSYPVAIVPTATTGPPILGPRTLRIHSGTLTSVFAIGDPVAGTMDAVVQELRIPTRGARVPSRVDTGDGGQAAGLFADSPGAGSTVPAGGWPGTVGLFCLLGGLALVVAHALHRLAGPGAGRPWRLRR